MFGVAGGIITLVTGASLASIFEIIYFLTVRFWEEGAKVSQASFYHIETYLFNWQENEDKDTTFDLKDADYDDDDYKGDIKSKDYEEDKLQNVETIQNSPPATSPDSFGKVTIDFQQSSTKKISRLEAAQKLRPHTGDLELQHLPGLLATLHQSCLDSFCFVLFMTTG